MEFKFRRLLYDMSPVLLLKYIYKKVTGKRLRLDNPQTFDEKLIWLNLDWRHPLKTICADKYSVRSYVEEHDLGHMLPDLLGVYTTPEDINFDVLPNRFVLKCTHGCNFNIFCLDKSMLNIEETNRRLNKWVKINYSRFFGELHYASIKPRIICEPYLGDPTGNRLDDYKFHCFNGKVHCTLVCTERESGSTKYSYYDRGWRNKLAYETLNLSANRDFPRPGAYNEMVRAAETLSKPFPFVRVDFYSIDGKAVFGEMTFTPSGCIDPELTELAQDDMGRLINLPNKYLG